MKIGFIFGNGSLPEELLSKYHNCVCALIDSKPKNIHNAIEFQCFKITEIKKIITFFKKNQVTHICFAGGVQKPKISLKLLNFQTISILFHILFLPNKGDNFLLNAVVSFIKKQGFDVISPTELLPNLLTSSGCLTKTKPKILHEKSIELGKKFLNDISKYDISQACIVENSCITALEGIEGTKSMILRMKEFNKNDAILVKMPKVGQNLKVDMPTIGIETVRDCIEYGICGIVIKAESTIFLNQDEAITLANESGIFILSIIE
jgi:DUF1009 family protein